MEGRAEGQSGGWSSPSRVHCRRSRPAAFLPLAAAGRANPAPPPACYVVAERSGAALRPGCARPNSPGAPPAAMAAWAP